MSEDRDGEGWDVPPINEDRRCTVALLTMMPSKPLLHTAIAMSGTLSDVNSGPILKNISGLPVGTKHAAASSFAWMTSDKSSECRSVFLCEGTSDICAYSHLGTYRKPGVLGFDTFATSASMHDAGHKAFDNVQRM